MRGIARRGRVMRVMGDGRREEGGGERGEEKGVEWCR